jgi:hypothetical protein
MEKSSTPTAILKTVEKTRNPNKPFGANLFRKKILPVNLLDLGFCGLWKS